MAVADILIFSGGPKSHESQGTGNITNKFVSHLVKSEVIGRAAAPGPQMSVTALRTGGALVPSAFLHGEQEGQELPFIFHSFQLSYLVKGHFSAL